jgi:hypothetical protein
METQDLSKTVSRLQTQVRLLGAVVIPLAVLPAMGALFLTTRQIEQTRTSFGVGDEEKRALFLASASEGAAEFIAASETEDGRAALVRGSARADSGRASLALAGAEATLDLVGGKAGWTLGTSGGAGVSAARTDNGAVISMTDSSGRVRIELAVDGDVASVSLLRSDGTEAWGVEAD